MIKKSDGSLTSYAMRGREPFNLAEHSACKMFFPCDETYGTRIVDSVNGIVIDAAQEDACYPGSNVTASHTVNNAVGFTTATDFDALVDYMRLASGDFPQLDLDKCVLSVLVCKVIQKENLKFPVGGAGGPLYLEGSCEEVLSGKQGFTLAMQGGFHGMITDGTHTIAPSATVSSITDDTDYIMYCLWDADTKTYTVRVADLDGTLVEEIVTVEAVNYPRGVITPANVTKLFGMHCYTWQIYNFDTAAPPADLAVGLQWVANHAVDSGIKAPYLPWSI